MISESNTNPFDQLGSIYNLHCCEMAMVFSVSDHFVWPEDDLYSMHSPNSPASIDNVQNEEQNDGKVLVFLCLQYTTYSGGPPLRTRILDDEIESISMHLAGCPEQYWDALRRGRESACVSPSLCTQLVGYHPSKCIDAVLDDCTPLSLYQGNGISMKHYDYIPDKPGLSERYMG
jgi:hypothetical protein